MDRARRRGVLLRTALLLAIGVLTAGSAAADPTPASRVDHYGYSGSISIPTFATVWDTVIADTWTSHVTFDKGAGRNTLTASSGGLFSIELRVLDRLDVVGLPAGTPLDATLQYQLDGWSSQNCGGSGCGVTCVGTVATPSDSASADATQSGPSNLTKTLSATPSVPVHFVAGTPVAVQFALRYGTGPGQDNAQADVTGTWRVVGLPPGVHAIGTTGGDVTPVRPASWGRIKSLYR